MTLTLVSQVSVRLVLQLCWRDLVVPMPGLIPAASAQAGTKRSLPLAPPHSYVRLQGFWAKQFSSGPCRSVRGDDIQLHGMGDGALRRRSIKLLSAGWLPHSVFRPGASPV